MMHIHQASLNLSPCMGVAGPQDGLRMEFDDIYRSLFRNPMRYMEVVELLGSRRRGYTRVVRQRQQRAVWGILDGTPTGGMSNQR